ncbi:unnamed protein product [Closterium sp. NIES-65]|nr:unnamed protein product [Closterium sp. NIES-65]
MLGNAGSAMKVYAGAAGCVGAWGRAGQGCWVAVQSALVPFECHQLGLVSPEQCGQVRVLDRAAARSALAVLDLTVCSEAVLSACFSTGPSLPCVPSAVPALVLSVVHSRSRALLAFLRRCLDRFTFNPRIATFTAAAVAMAAADGCEVLTAACRLLPRCLPSACLGSVAAEIVAGAGCAATPAAPDGVAVSAALGVVATGAGAGCVVALVEAIAAVGPAAPCISVAMAAGPAVVAATVAGVTIAAISVTPPACISPPPSPSADVAAAGIATVPPAVLPA